MDGHVLDSGGKAEFSYKYGGDGAFPKADFEAHRRAR